MRTSRLLIYDFYIRSARKRQLAYTTIFAVMLLYAVISGIFLKRAEHEVAFEVVVLTVLMVSASPLLAEVFEWLSKGVMRESPLGGRSRRELSKGVVGADMGTAPSHCLAFLSDVVAATAISVVVAAFAVSIAAYSGAIAGLTGGIMELTTHDYILMGVALYLGIDHFLLRRRMER